jgi:glycosyltransferase involved in cell wall biosynthesis
MNNKSPYFPDIGVVGLVPESWGGPWMPRHHVLTRLSDYFNVVWVSPARPWRNMFSREAGFKAWQNDPERTCYHGFTLYKPKKWLPKFYGSHVLHRLTERQRRRQIAHILHEKGCRKTILYLWRPEFEEALDLYGFDLSCYHIDDEYTFSDVEKPVSDIEARVIKRVDQVFIHSHALMEKKGLYNRNTMFLPNGVNYKEYATPRDEPDDMRSIPHPRVGYIGLIKKQMDIALLVHLARVHAEWSFVLVGPYGNLNGVEHLIKELDRMSNVHFLGGKPIEKLPAYAQHMDVLTLCYDCNGYTEYIYPMKLHEYLACGRPVVGSPIRSLLEFSHVVSIARTPEEWSLALNRAISPDAVSADRVTERKRVAGKYDWDGLVQRIAHTMCERLGSEFPGLVKGVAPSLVLDPGPGIDPVAR